MRVAAARVASRRGSSIRIAALAAPWRVEQASGTSVVLPAPGGATSTALRPSARDFSSAGMASVTGSSGSMLVVRRILRHMRTKAAVRGLHAAGAQSDADHAARLLEPAGAAPWRAPGRQRARATASLVSDVDSVAPGQPFRVGLRLQLATGLAHLLAEPWRCRRAAGAEARRCPPVRRPDRSSGRRRSGCPKGR